MSGATGRLSITALMFSRKTSKRGTRLKISLLRTLREDTSMPRAWFILRPSPLQLSKQPLPVCLPLSPAWTYRTMRCPVTTISIAVMICKPEIVRWDSGCIAMTCAFWRECLRYTCLNSLNRSECASPSQLFGKARTLHAPVHLSKALPAFH